MMKMCFFRNIYNDNFFPIIFVGKKCERIAFSSLLVHTAVSFERTIFLFNLHSLFVDRMDLTDTELGFYFDVFEWTQSHG